MNSLPFHATTLTLFSMLAAIVLVAVTVMAGGRQFTSWVLLKFYSFFIQHK